MKTLVTLLGTIGLAFTNANNFLNINNSPKEVKEITYEFSENKKDIVHNYKTSSVSNPAYESWDFIVSTGLKFFQKPKSIRILEWFLNNGSNKIDWGSDHYDVFSVPLKITGKEINKINEGKITNEEVAYNRMNFSFKESYKDFLTTAEVVRGIPTALFFDNLDWHIQFYFVQNYHSICHFLMYI